METTPRAVAEMIAAGARATGAKVTYSTATDHGRLGLMHIEMPDGTMVEIKIAVDY